MSADTRREDKLSVHAGPPESYIYLPAHIKKWLGTHVAGHVCAPISLIGKKAAQDHLLSDGPSALISRESECKAGLPERTLGAKQARRQAPWAMRRLMTRASATSTSIRSPPGIRSNRKYRCSLSCAYFTCSGVFAVLQAFNAVLQQQDTELMLCLGHTCPCKGACHWLPARISGCS